MSKKIVPITIDEVNSVLGKRNELTTIDNRRYVPHISPHLHTKNCPYCGFKSHIKVKINITAMGEYRRQLKCHGCNKHFTVNKEYYDKNITK